MKKLAIVMALIFSLLGTSLSANPKFVAPTKAVTVVGVVTHAFTSNFKNYAYLEQSDRSSGICLETAELLAVGTAIKAQTTVSLSDNGELTLNALSTDVTVLGTDFPSPPPIALPQSMLGGGQFGYQPATEGGVGLNNVGLLVRLSGKITRAITTYIPPPVMTPVYTAYIDDGSGRKSDCSGVLGVKVHCRNSDYVEGQFRTIDGVVSLERFPDGTINPVILETASISTPTRGNLTVLTVNVSCGISASGKKAHVLTDVNSCEILLDSSGNGSGVLTLLAGTYAVSCTIPGFVSDLKKVVLASSGGSVSFNLTAAKTMIDILPRQTKVTPGQNTDIDVIVRDEMGNRIENAPLIWSVSLGSLTDAGLTTDQNGTAHATFHSTQDHAVSTIHVTSNDLTGVAYIDQMTIGDPYLRIIDPIDGATVSGTMNISVECYDTNPDGSNNIIKKKLQIDGVNCGTFKDIDPDNPTGLRTVGFANNWYTLAATALDQLGNTMRSNEIRIYINNMVDNLEINQQTLVTDNPDREPFVISGSSHTSNNLLCVITDSMTQEVVFSQQTMGGAGYFAINWDGKVGGEYRNTMYEVTLEEIIQQGKSSTSETSFKLIDEYLTTTPWLGGRALICGVYRASNNDPLKGRILEMTSVANACKKRLVPYTMIGNAFWEDGVDDDPIYKPHVEKGLSTWFITHQGQFQYFFLAGEGASIQCSDGKWRSVISFADQSNVYGVNGWDIDPLNDPNRPYIKVRAFTGVPLYGFKIVWMNTCKSSGNWDHGDDPSIAWAFGIGGSGSGKVYMGWLKEYYSQKYPIFELFSANGAEFTKGIWDGMSDGLTFGWALYRVDNFPYPWELGWMSWYKGPYGDYAAGYGVRLN